MPKSDQGVTPNRYRVIPRTLIFVTQGERVLLLKGAPHKRLWANRYNGIGGHVERGEDLLTAAKRELDEEAALQNGDLWLCGTVMVDASDDTGIAIHIFRCDYPPGKALHPRDSEEGQLEWVDAAQLGGYNLVDDLRVLLPVVLAHPRGVPAFAARSFYDEADQLQVVFAS